ncbi:MAG: hypothetical protein U1F67_18235 [Rubrivivax sp.]
MRIGQPVVLTADLYGGKVEYSGRVLGLGAGTGARSRCCRRRTPPATGSRWCSACRCASKPMPSSSLLPVAHGLVDEAVDRRARCFRRAGGRERRRPRRASTTAVFEGERERADRRVEEIVRANRVPGTRRGSRPRLRADAASGTAQPPLVSASR